MALFKSIMFHAVPERFPCAGTGRYECSDNLGTLSARSSWVWDTFSNARELGIVVNHADRYLILFPGRTGASAKPSRTISREVLDLR
jgi:hypothetical protein